MKSWLTGTHINSTALKCLAACLSASTALGQGDAANFATGEPISPIPDMVSAEPEKVALGQRLFFEKRLSLDNTISCAACHDLSHGGADSRRVSIGIGGQKGTINSLTVFNSSLNFRLFWDGRAATLEEQIDGPLLNHFEMGSNWDTVVQRLTADPGYRQAFQQVFPDGVTRANVRSAIACFERTLLTPNSRFDQFLKGKKDSISPIEKLGYTRFKSFGCVSCHQGINIGGNMYQSLGVMADYFKDRGTPIAPGDLGRFNVTHLEQDRFVFRVPSLRNVALTAPYFHDGSVASLEEAVEKMAYYQLGRELSKDEISSIVAFLKTLTADLPTHSAGEIK